MGLMWCVTLSLVSQEALQLLRADDDKIIYKLNTSLPTTSFSEQGSATEHCKDLYQQVQWLVYEMSVLFI